MHIRLCRCSSPLSTDPRLQRARQTGAVHEGCESKYWGGQHSTAVGFFFCIGDSVLIDAIDVFLRPSILNTRSKYTNPKLCLMPYASEQRLSKDLACGPAVGLTSVVTSAPELSPAS